MTLIRKPSQLTTSANIKALVYGQPGLGKSTIALSTPMPLLLDFDGGVHRINTAHQCDTLQVESYQQFLDVLQEDLTPYKTIVVDTVGKMLDYMGNYIIEKEPKMGRKDGALSLQGYGARKCEFVRILKLLSIMGKHVIFVAHEKEEKDGETRFIRPEIGGSSGGDLIKELDLVGYMEAIGKKRTISFDPCEKFYAKNTCNLPEKIEVPVILDTTGMSIGKNVFMSGIFSAYAASLEKRKEMAGEYEVLIDLIRSKVDEITDGASANEFIEWVSGFDGFIWDSKLQASMMMVEKTKGLGLKLNKARRYE